MAENKSNLEKILWTLVLIAFVIGVIGLIDRLIYGHQHADYGSYIPWGLWVAGYIYLIGLSAGAFLMSTLVYVFKIKTLEKIGKVALLTALATLVGALLTIWMDLGHMGRAWRLMFRTNFGSVMGWMAWLYSLYFVLLLFEFWYAMRADFVKHAKETGLKGNLCKLLTFGKTDISEEAVSRDKKTLQILGSIGIPLAVAFHGSVGAIFGVVGARPYWNSGLTPIIFLVGALLSGGALLGFIIASFGPGKGTKEHADIVSLIGKIILPLLLFDVLLEWAEVTIGLWHAVPSEAAALKMVLFGQYWWVFWFVHVGLGIVVPALLLIFAHGNVKAIRWAGFLIAVTFIAVRLNIVLPGLAVPELQGLIDAFSGPGLKFDYFPTWMEWAVFLFSVSVSALIFLFGKTLLPVLETNSYGKED